MARLRAQFGLNRYEADEYYRMALEFYRKHNLNEAITYMNYALQLQPKNPEYLAARGFFHLENGVLERAQTDFDMALGRNAFEVLANYGKGVIAYQSKDNKTALDYFMKAWAAEETRAETHYYIALCLYRLARYADARAWMLNAYRLFEQKADKAHLKDADRWMMEIDSARKKAE